MGPSKAVLQLGGGGGVRGHHFHHSEAESVCFNISFCKVKMPFFFIKNNAT